ncbi:MAG: 50S ribosomal protein L28 [Alphaproteobacteria bacterium GM7ARS4]|nr:50S ribosomal protein L28 [Alphaproteobacteria bacterium GM7ARS4]
MTRKCAITHKTFQTGNKVSHAHNKVRKRFLSNIQKTSRYSEILEQRIRFRATPKGLKTIERYGGIDAWLMRTKFSRLDDSLRPWKIRIQKRHGQKGNISTSQPQTEPPTDTEDHVSQTPSP